MKRFPVSARLRLLLILGLTATGMALSLPFFWPTPLNASPADRTPYRMRLRASFPQPLFPPDNPLTDAGVALGQALFFDPRLGADGRVSCASCHNPADSLSDGRRFSRGVNGTPGRRQSMPLINLAWRRSFFWDGRSPSLREQVLHPLTDPTEMAANLDEITARLNQFPAWQKAFATAFPETPRATSSTIALALEQFLLTLTSQQSRFDLVRDGGTTLSTSELRGFAFFMAEHDPGRGIRGGDCFHCHQPPLFTNDRFANNGLVGKALLGGEVLSDLRPPDGGRHRLPPPGRRGPRRGPPEQPDAGRGEITQRPQDQNTFKVPTLRNVALTAPYMHDGRHRTLDEAVDHYSHGIRESQTLDINIAKHADQVRFTAEEKADLIAFLETLTDSAFIERAHAMESYERQVGPSRWTIPGTNDHPRRPPARP